MQKQQNGFLTLTHAAAATLTDPACPVPLTVRGTQTVCVPRTVNGTGHAKAK